MNEYDEIELEQSESEDEHNVNLAVFSMVTKKLIQKQIKLNNTNVQAMIDTGSEITLISKQIARQLKLNMKPYNGAIPVAANGKALPILGEVKVTIKINDNVSAILIKTIVQVIEKLPKHFDVLIGQDILCEAKIEIDCSNGEIKIKREDLEINPDSTDSDSGSESDLSTDSALTETSTDSEQDNLMEALKIDPKMNVVNSCELQLDINPEVDEITTKRFYAVTNEYRDVFAINQEELGRTNLFTHKIDTGDHPPISNPPYQQSAMKREITKDLIEGMLNDNLIVESFSPWSSPVVLVSKKTKDWRLCVDYRKINAITKKDRYPLPDINTSLDCLQGSQYFSLLDLRSGYHQVELNPEDRQKTSFCTAGGLWEYKVMPFGLCNAPATFQRLMDVCLSGLKWA